MLNMNVNAGGESPGYGSHRLLTGVIFARARSLFNNIYLLTLAAGLLYYTHTEHHQGRI